MSSIGLQEPNKGPLDGLVEQRRTDHLVVHDTDRDQRLVRPDARRELPEWQSPAAT